MNNELKEKNRRIAKGLGWAVYAGGVVVAWAFSLAFFMQAMDGALLRVIVGIGVTAVGINAIVLANALHFYAVTGWHRGMAIGLYAVDMLLMLMNVLVSAGETTGSMPLWAQVYEPYAYSTIIVPVITWGVLWILDPWNNADVKKQAEQDKFILSVIRQAGQLIEGPEGKKIVADYARALASQQIMNGDALGVRADSITPNDTGNTGSDTDKPADRTAEIEKLLEGAGLNGKGKELAQEIIASITDPTKASIGK